MNTKELKKVLLKEIILSKNVFIIGHNNIDLDAFGAMIGISLICKKLRKKSFAIIDDETLEESMNEAIKLKPAWIKINKTKQVKQHINSKSLLIIVDTNKQQLVSLKDELDKFKKIIIIDHHKPNEDTIKTENIFVSTNSSSTCEIVTELLKMFNVKISKKEADLLLSGIILDTNHFTYKMKRKTFYCCYYLLSKGADMLDALALLKQSLSDFIERQKTLENTIQIGSTIIAKTPERKISLKSDLAKSADQLIQFKGILTAFVIGKIDKKTIGISARNMGKVNISKIMEEIGYGGGTESEAATVIENSTIKETEQKLLELLNK